MRNRILACLVLLLLTACAPFSATDLPTAVVMPPTTAPSATGSATPLISSPTPPPSSPTVPPSETPPAEAPTEEDVPTDTPLALPTFYLAPTVAATAVPQPDAEAGVIQLLSPGPLSKVVSPAVAYGYAIPGYNNRGRLDLYGEDGGLLASQLLQLNSIYKWAYFYWSLDFKIPSVGELGRLSLTTRDQYGRINAIYSVHVLLLAQGVSIPNPPGNLRERCVIDSPVPGRHNPGGTLTVTGKMRPFSSQPLTVTLVTRDGRTIASQDVPIQPAADDSYVPFSTSLAYNVAGGTWTQLVVRQDDDRIPGTMYLFSYEIYLQP